MANYYASSLAGGGGTGTSGSPFTFAEMVAYINASFVNGDIAWIKADGMYSTVAYSITKAATVSSNCRMEGYTTTIGDGGIATVQRSNVGAVAFGTHSGAYWVFKNLIFDANNLGTLAVSSVVTHYYINCTFKRAGTSGVSGDSLFYNCNFNTNATYGLSNVGGRLVNCISTNNGGIGSAGFQAMNSVFSNNGSYGINCTATGMTVTNCVVNNNTLGGIKVDATVVAIVNTIISNHAAGFGINSTVTGEAFFYNCDFYNNSSDTNIAANLINKKTLDPQFNNAVTFDFRRTGNNLSGIGLSEVGPTGGFNYETSIGVAPDRMGMYVIPTFAGITGLVTASEGLLEASWTAATNHTHYHIYIQAGTAVGLFAPANFTQFAQGSVTSTKIKVLPDGVSYLDYSTTYYVGVRASNGSEVEDTNTVSLSLIPSDNINVAVTAIPQNTWDKLLTSISTAGSIGKLLKDDIDAAITTRAPSATALSTAQWTNGRASNLDNLDATVSSRLATAGYTAPDNADIATIKSDIENVTTGLIPIKTAINAIPTNPLLDTDVRLNDLDATISSRAPASTAVSNIDYTAGRAANLDNLDATVSSLSTGAALASMQTDVINIKTNAQLIADIEQGRWKIVGNQMIFYKPDNVTEIFRVNLFDALSVPAMTNVFERVKV